ncbi:hemin uptake protein HemP [Chelativorans sp. Marseille-P2723]|uniref:hemin uptake protein HemP n=1 Tax=Chelativorans sp. Marseille-P2723 TaxID=2709133 RepID=UPI001570CB15|nr:hemin uptake protein HemP [Chelativorans sp. Marseille-P2723]
MPYNDSSKSQERGSTTLRPLPLVRTYSSRELFSGATEIAIEHAGSLYRLKITRQGKLILNK